MNIMSLISGGNPLASLTLSALTGGAGGFMMEFAKQVISQVAQNAIDNTALPQPLKELMKGAITDQIGPGLEGGPKTNEAIAEIIADETGGSLFDAQTLVDEISHMIMMFLETGQTGSDTNRKGKATKQGEGTQSIDDNEFGVEGGSWMMDLAVAMGGLINDKMDEVRDAIEHVNDVKSGEGDMVSSGHKLSGAGKRAAREGPGAVAVMQGRMQELGFLLNAVSSAIKTAGQGASTLASKQ